MMNLLNLLPYLISHGLLTMPDWELLQNRSPTELQRKIDLFLFIDKKPNGYQKFFDAVSEEPEHLGHRDITRILIGSNKPAVVPATSKFCTRPSRLLLCCC